MSKTDFVDKTKEPISGEMKIITVIPIDRGIFKDELSYFSKKSIPLGSIVSVPVKNREIKALVIKEQDAKELKTELKSQDFSLKKITNPVVQNFFQDGFIEAVEATAQYFALPVGQLIKSLVPKAILDNLDKTPKTKKAANIDLSKVIPDVYILQEPDEERFALYKSLIRESFARNNSVFFCLPTISDINKIVPFIEKGITPYTFIFHGDLTGSEITDRWNKALKTKHPIVIIATPLFLSLPRHDVKTLIVDHENSQHYRTRVRPLFDIRYFAEKYARARKIKLIFGDIALRTETIFRQGKQELIPFSPLKYRSFSDAKNSLISMKNEIDQTKQDTPILSEELLDTMRLSIENNERMFLFTTRRGVAGTTVCNDCGLIINCENCKSPLVIHKMTDHKRGYLCHKCNTAYKIKDACPQCGGWRLALLGTGVEQIEEAINKSLPNATVFKIDSDSIKTSKKARDTANKFIASPGSILIGTEMSLYYLNEKIENSAIASIDTLFALPDFRISEKILNLLVRIRELTSKRLLIQTRNPEEKVFDYVLKGNLLDFYREEISERKDFGYPPFATLIKITREGTEDTVQSDMAELETLISEYDPKIYPAFTSRVKNKHRMHALIKLAPEQWVDDKLSNILKSLPPNFIISVDPEEIL